eukprot:TRINITY_DN132013_c0_g1_i1.p1 TRINITY_DN132013_c0_g1~~TRINITY_DN132013_c0_g1_i1.p1  ORF type:complete len:375 (-),score=20.06 TRINITY_DN132013_c0_g1_i1:40-1128(-)
MDTEQAGSAPPPYAPSAISDVVNWAGDLSENERVDNLRNMGFPRGIARIMVRTTQQYTHLIKIFDTSGSMRTVDGRVWNPKVCKWVTTTRWIELIDALSFNHRTMESLGITDMVSYWPLFGDRYISLPPGQPYFTSSQLGEAIPWLREFNPAHSTPIIETLKSVQSYLDGFPRVRPHITIFTDGMDDHCAESITPLATILTELKKNYCADFVVRLITDDDKTVSAYNDLDKSGPETLNMDVLDDLKSEQEEIILAGNGYVICDNIFTELRIACSSLPCLDNLDERPLSQNELKQLCAIVYGIPQNELPDPTHDWGSFEKFMVEIIKNESQHAIDPVSGQQKTWIDLKKAREKLGPRPCCNIS